MEIRTRAIHTVFCVALIAATASTGHGQSLTADTSKTYRAAFDAAHNGNWEQARTLAVQGGIPVLARTIDWMRLSSSKSGASLDEIMSFVEANPAWDGFLDLSRRAEGQMTVPSETARVLRWFAGHDVLTTRGRVAHVRALIATGETSRAETLARETWLIGDFSTEVRFPYRRIRKSALTGE